MAQKRFGPTRKESLTVRHRDLACGLVVKNSFTTAAKSPAHDLEQTIARNMVRILEV